jgi:hypothetical protein
MMLDLTLKAFHIDQKYSLFQGSHILMALLSDFNLKLSLITCK